MHNPFNFLLRPKSSYLQQYQHQTPPRYPSIQQESQLDSGGPDLICTARVIVSYLLKVFQALFYYFLRPIVENPRFRSQQIASMDMPTNDDIIGDKIPFDLESEFRKFCYQALNLQGRVQTFPGSHPVSLDKDNLQLLRQRYYYATWKADGTRYMMLITNDGCFLIDRRFGFRRINMRFPCRNVANEPQRFHHYTLLDGEMVIDTVSDTQKVRRYLIYDMMAINGIPIVHKPFYERWMMIQKELIEPRRVEKERMSMTTNRNYEYELEPFMIRRKDFWQLSTVTKVLTSLIPTLPHAADGLIFQGWDDPYVPRTHHGLLKWKYAEMNSVDFLFEMVDNRGSLYLYERGRRKPMDGHRVVFPDRTDPPTCSGKIIECCWDSEEGVWKCMRMRPDKGSPNEFRTYEKVVKSIRDNITEDVLLNEIKQIIRLPVYVDRSKIEIKPKVHQHHSSHRM